MGWSGPAPGLLLFVISPTDKREQQIKQIMANLVFSTFVLQVALLSPSRAQNSCIVGCICLPEIKYINCSSQNISETLPNFPFSTEYLDLSRNHIIQIQPYSLGNLLGLKVLLLQDNMVSFVSDGAFFNLQSLQKLDVSHNLISYLGYGFSLGLNSLTELSLAFNNLTILENNIFNHLDSLVKLDLRANCIQKIKSRAFNSMTTLRHLYLNENDITTLELATFSTLRSLEMLQLRQNKIAEIHPGVFMSLCNVVLLDLSFNKLSGLQFKTLLSICASNAHVLLEGNPWHCDCDLQRVFRKLDDIHRLFLDDYHKLQCSDPEELRGSLIVEVAHELCIAETVTVLILTGTVLITVVAAILMEKNKRQSLDKDCTEEQGGLEGYCDN